MSQFVIENNVPVPNKGSQYPFGDMAVGQSVQFPTDAVFLMARISAYRYGEYHEKEFTARKKDRRIWRVK